MKHQLFVAGAILCALITTGCTKDLDGAAVQVGKQVTMTMQTTANTSQTRADYTKNDSKMAFSWRSGDELSVVVNGVSGNENAQLSTAENGKSVPFRGNVTAFTETKNIYAFYPYEEAAYVVTGGNTPATATVALTLPTTQQYTVGGAISNSFMVGVGTATATSGGSINASAGLKQVMSIIKLNMTNPPGKVTGVKLKCTEALFPTTAIVKLSDATISSPGNLKSELFMTVTDHTSRTNKSISFAMLPADLTEKEITIEVTFESGKVISIRKTGINFKRNIHYVMTVDGTTESTDYILLNGIKVAIGNLVADGANGAKIGTPDDYGLYFQFGSLVGWSGGKSGDGIGTSWYDVKVSSRVTPLGYTGSTAWSRSWKGDATSDNATLGTGDPCRYYLKGSWRLPTKNELDKLFENGGYPSTGPWTWMKDESSPTGGGWASHTAGLKFRIAGARTKDGSLAAIFDYGFYWSGTPPKDEQLGYGLFFASSFMPLPTGTLGRNAATPIRCVQE